MPVLLIRQTVADFATWRAVFAEQAELRRANGAGGERLFHTGDAGEVVALLEWDDLERARLFADSDDWREAMTRAGVTSEPDCWFLEDAPLLA
ncbi:MAG: hypothetical protein QM692_24850 [Thermomicrobiales bacterium]